MIFSLRAFALVAAACACLFVPNHARASLVSLNIADAGSFISSDSSTRWRQFLVTSPTDGAVIGRFELGSIRTVTSVMPGAVPTIVTVRNWLYSFNTDLQLEPATPPFPPLLTILRPTAQTVLEWWNQPSQTTGMTVERHYFAFSTPGNQFGWIHVDFGVPKEPNLTVLSGGLIPTDMSPAPVPLPASFGLLLGGLGVMAARRKSSFRLRSA